MKSKTLEVILRLLACYFFVAALIYLIASFYSWNLSPAYWKDDLRLVSALLITVFGALLFVVVINYKDDIQK